MKGAIPGWSPVDPEQARDRARRPIGDIVREVFQVYGGHFEPVLVLAALIEGSLALISLPYVVLTLRAFLASLEAMGDVLRAPASGQAARAMAQAFERFRDPWLGVYGGIVGVTPLLGAILLSAALGAYLVSGDPAKRTAAEALRKVLRRWAPLLLPVVALAALSAIFTVWSYGFSAASFDRAPLSTDLNDLGLSFAVSILAPLAIVVGLYLMVRWIVAAAALVIESIGLRQALARSASLTRRRRMHVGINLVVVGLVWTFLSWLVLGPAYLIAGVIEAGGGGPLLAIPLALYVIGRIVFAPILPILTVILYRDFQAAGPMADAPGIDDKAAPPGWGRPG